MVTSWPNARAASRTRNGNRPLPAIRPSITALQFHVPGSGFHVRVHVRVQGSMFRVPGSSAEPRTLHHEHRTRTSNTNLEPGTWNSEGYYSSATSSSVRLVDLRRITPRCEVRMNSTR